MISTITNHIRNNNFFRMHFSISPIRIWKNLNNLLCSLICMAVSLLLRLIDSLKHDLLDARHATTNFLLVVIILYLILLLLHDLHDIYTIILLCVKRNTIRDTLTTIRHNNDVTAGRHNRIYTVTRLNRVDSRALLINQLLLCFFCLFVC